jgi:predicted HTH domain antitoxin
VLLCLLPVVSITIEIPREIAEALPGPPDHTAAEVRKELALALYARGALTTAQVCSWLGLTRWEGEELLAQRRVPRSYLADELTDEIRNARRGQ